MALARQHLDECIQRHEQCCKSSTSSPCLPTRLVDCADLARPRLVSTIGERGEYLALSYVWGGDQVHKTTIANLSTYEQGISLHDLPLTIRDAIYVTHMLGFRWLWVDSLCIVQDSETDKANEIGRMHHIYRYAHLTIMAGSAKSVHEGFLQERPPPDIVLDDGVALPFICPPCPTTLVDREDCSAALPRVGTVFVAPIYSSITGREYSYELGRMATRAWCTQEYLMSPRALIFTPTTLLFRCLSTVQGVGSSFYQIRDDTRIPNSFFLPPVAPAEELDAKERRDVHTTWMKVVEDYTRRTASDESDKLVACAAIAEQFHGILGSEYLAGLWRSDALLVHLLWRTGDKFEAKSRGCPHTRPTAYRSPSWSWAAIEGSIDHVFPKVLSLGDPQTVALAEIAECRVTLEDPALRFGRVMDGVLVLRGTLIFCRGGLHKITDNLLSVPLPSFEQVRCQLQRGSGGSISDEEGDVYSTKPGDRATANVYMDCEFDEPPERMWLVPFVRTQPKHREEHVLHGIALELAPPSNGSGASPQECRFRRIGYLCNSVQVARPGKDFPKHSLWHPLLQAVKGGERLWTDIVII
ncbi:hypothetical protein TRAPUB_9535 [Trametes pubescens]|uniref:Heterokaryon incompatibility domain-containing protein n=1 Tax=Trametes pubescens TaxID=154538 RepID=A0A1M2W236_TRAPU|nr:hypothetical protein TRAPUB_9535 [Trametes pubescens]